MVTLSACIGPADDGSSSSSTLAPLVTSDFITLAPTTTLGATTTSSLPTAADVAVEAQPTPTATAVTVAGAAPDTSASASTADDDTDSGTGTPAGTGSTYTVVANDTVYGIARRYGLSADALAQFNGWSDGSAHSIYPGDDVAIPKGATASATPTTSATAASTTTAAPTSTGAATTVAPGPGGTYLVVAGDYLTAIAAKTGTTVSAIVAANGWADGADHPIFPGQTIKLPAKS